MQAKQKFQILTEGQLKGVSPTCQKYKVSRTLYYRWLKRYQTMGMQGLEEVKRHFTPPNKTHDEVVSATLDLIKTYPTYGPKAITYLLEESGTTISESAVYNIMKRKGLSKKEARLKYAKAKPKGDMTTLPPMEEMSSGTCWVFWLTDFGHIKALGHLYFYTFFDLKSHIACTRVYDENSLVCFEETLSAAALPIAQTLRFDTKNLCFFEDDLLLKHLKSRTLDQINQVLKRHNFDIHTDVLSQHQDTHAFHALRETYTTSLLGALLPKITVATSLDAVKLLLQKQVRTYNIHQVQTYDLGSFSPIDYHIQTTGTQKILPLWAYLDRQY